MYLDHGRLFCFACSGNIVLLPCFPLEGGLGKKAGLIDSRGQNKVSGPSNPWIVHFREVLQKDRHQALKMQEVWSAVVVAVKGGLVRRRIWILDWNLSSRNKIRGRGRMSNRGWGLHWRWRRHGQSLKNKCKIPSEMEVTPPHKLLSLLPLLSLHTLLPLLIYYSHSQ